MRYIEREEINNFNINMYLYKHSDTESSKAIVSTSRISARVPICCYIHVIINKYEATLIKYVCSKIVLFIYRITGHT